MTIKFNLVLICSFFLVSHISAQITFEGVNAPEIYISDWARENTSLKDKTIILEFWATWCGGCVEAIPHLNEMAEKYGSDEVVFISMNSFDKKEKIEKFLQKTEMKTYIAMDDEKKTYDAFEVGAMPKTYLIDKNGYLRWQGVPGLLTEEFMESYLEKDEILIHKVMEDPLLYSLNISLTKDRSVSNVAATMGDKYGFAWKNRGLTDIIFQSYSMIGLKRHEFRFEGKIPLEPALDIEFKADKSINDDFIYNDLVNRLSYMFDFIILTMVEEMEIWHLTISDNELFTQSKSENQDGKFSFTDEATMELNNCEAYNLKRVLEQLTEKTIIADELDNPVKYNWIIPKRSLNDITETLHNKYGLSLEKKIENIEVRVIKFK